jgi:hypothetical protein
VPWTAVDKVAVTGAAVLVLVLVGALWL